MKVVSLVLAIMMMAATPSFAALTAAEEAYLKARRAYEKDVKDLQVRLATKAGERAAAAAAYKAALDKADSDHNAAIASLESDIATRKASLEASL